MMLDNKKMFKSQINDFIQKYPDLFPAEIKHGYWLDGFCDNSIKQNIRIRRLKMKQNKDVYLIFPSFVMPYMTEKTDVADNILFLSKYPVPNWALAYVFKLDEKHIERMINHHGNCSIVGSTVKGNTAVPKDLVADEKHTNHNGDKSYIAITAAKGCFLGATVSEKADETELTKAYQIFKKEALDVEPDYQPSSVNIDGWTATSNAWKTLFENIKIVYCFLHALLSIKNVSTKKTEELFNQIKDRVWKAYHSKSKHAFAQRLRRLKEWVAKCTETKLKEKVLKLCQRKEQFILSYDDENIHRTSNMVDRMINFMDKFLFNRKYLRGQKQTANKSICSFSLTHNFSPYCPKTVKAKKGIASPFQELNGFVYHSNWLQNMLIATSRNGYRNYPKKTG